MAYRDYAERMATNEVVNSIDFDAFTAAVRTELVPCVDLTKCSLPHASLHGVKTVYSVTKTHRAPGGSPGECDGTSPISAETLAVAERIASRFGLSVRWDECEKGFGDFEFALLEGK